MMPMNGIEGPGTQGALGDRVPLYSHNPPNIIFAQDGYEPSPHGLEMLWPSCMRVCIHLLVQYLNYNRDGH